MAQVPTNDTSSGDKPGSEDNTKESTDTKKEVKYYYIEKDIELTSEHLALFKELQQYREDVLSKKIEWHYHHIEDKWQVEPMDVEALLKENEETHNNNNANNNDNSDNKNDDNENTKENTNNDSNNSNETNNNNNNNTENNDENDKNSKDSEKSENKESQENNDKNSKDENKNEIKKNVKVGDKDVATEEFYEYFREFTTTQTLIRHLVGADYSVDKAKESLLKTVEWRILSKMDDIVPQQFERVLSCKGVYCLNKFDKNGHPICYFKVLKEALDDPWVLVKAAVYTVVCF